MTEYSIINKKYEENQQKKGLKVRSFRLTDKEYSHFKKLFEKMKKKRKKS